MALNNPQIIVGLKMEELSKSKEKLQQQVEKLNGKLNLNISKVNLDVDIEKVQKKLNTLSKGLEIKIAKITMDNTNSINKIKKQIQNEVNSDLKIEGKVSVGKLSSLNKDLLNARESAQVLLETLTKVQNITFPHITESKNTIKDFNIEANKASDSMNKVVANSEKLKEAMRIVNSQEKDNSKELTKQAELARNLSNEILNGNNSKIKLANGKEGSVSRIFGSNGELKSATITTNFDKQRQEVQKFGWTVKQVGDESIKEFGLLSTKIVDNKAKLESSLNSQSKYFENLRQKVLQLKQLSTSSSKKLGNYDEDGKNVQKLIELEKELYNLKRRKTEIPNEEMNKEAQKVANITREIQSEINFKKELINTNKFIENQLNRINSLRGQLEGKTLTNGGTQNELLANLNQQETALNKILEEKRLINAVEKQNYSSNINSIKNETSELLKLEGVRRNQANDLSLDQDKYLNRINQQLAKLRSFSEKNRLKLGNYDLDGSQLQKIVDLEQQVLSLEEKSKNNIGLTKEARNQLNEAISKTRAEIQKAVEASKTELQETKFIENEQLKLNSLREEAKKIKSKSAKNQVLDGIREQERALNALLSKEEQITDVEKQRLSLNTRILENSVKQANAPNLGFSGILKRMGNYFGAGSLIFGAISQFKEGIHNVIDLNSSMVDLKKVTTETTQTYQEFGDEANKTAIELGHSTKAVIDATALFAQASYDFQEAKKLAKTSLIYSNVGDISQEDASKSLISTMKGFGLQVEQSMSIVDKINNVSNNFAISAGGLGEALKRSSSALHSAGNDLNQSLAMMATANTIAQDPSSVGNGLKTISMRLRGIKQGADELNPKLQHMIKSITGVDITKQNGQFKSTYKILDEISKKWDNLNDKQHAYLAEQIAGKHQVTI